MTRQLKDARKNLTKMASFNLEEFVQFNPTEEKQELEAPTTEPTWDSYPNLWVEKEQSADPVSLINFDGATLFEEPYEDPFADLITKTSDAKLDFQRKLQVRRAKLEEMAKNLTRQKQWSLTESCSQHTNWKPSTRQVQAFSLFTIDFYPVKPMNMKDCSSLPSISDLVDQSQSFLSNRGCTTDEKKMAASMLNIFISHMPEYLA